MVASFDTSERRRFTADEFWRMVETGVIGEDEHVELLEGELIVMAAQGPIHSSLTVVIRHALERAYGDGWHVRDHSNVPAGRDSVPEPDLVVVRGDPRAYMKQLPGPEEIALVVEVAYTSLPRDRRKAVIYARAGYPAYWIVDVESRRIVVHTSPGAGGYGTVEVVADDGVVTPPSAGEVAVRALLP